MWSTHICVVAQLPSVSDGGPTWLQHQPAHTASLLWGSQPLPSLGVPERCGAPGKVGGRALVLAAMVCN